MSNPLIESMREAEIIDSVSIALPTLGRFYEEGEVIYPDFDPSDIEVKAVGIMAEMHARDPFLLAAGKGVAALVLQICPAIKEPGKLSEIDIEAILIASRIVSHGQDMNISITCNNPKLEKKKRVCEHEDTIKINLQEFIMRYEPFEIDDKFTVDLPELNQKVHLRPIDYEDAMEILKSTMFNMRDYEKFEKMKVDEFLNNDQDIEEYMALVNKATFTNIESIVDGVYCVEYNGGKSYNRDDIKEWVTSIHRDLAKRISIKQAELAVFLRSKTEIKYKCSECGYDNITHMELDPQKIFFSEVKDLKVHKTPSTTSKRSASTKKTLSRTSQR